MELKRKCALLEREMAKDLKRLAENKVSGKDKALDVRKVEDIIFSYRSRLKDILREL